MKNPRPSGTYRSATQGREEAAAELAIAALGYLAGDEERLERFLALSGLGPESLRAAARDPSFLAGVLDHLTGDEALLVAFANESGIDPLDVERARVTLSGRPEDTGAA